VSERLRPKAFVASEGAEDWRVLGDGATAFFRTESFEAGARLVQAIAELDGLDARHPDVDVRWDGVTVRLITITDGYYGLTERDLELARHISSVARNLGVTADPSVVHSVQIAIDALDRPAVAPFWRAVLGYENRGDGTDEEILDPGFRAPMVWFQQMDEPRPQRNRIHLDVWVAHDEAEARVAAALEAGGRLVSDAFAPTWWTLADVEGNEADVCTWQESASS
jgi:4a-hydroxytetrahydrobiopterin dehydratase